jgi:8-oxo-dGTP diphosphatase
VLLDARHENVLLVQRAIKPYLGWWDIPGGFLEYHEEAEAGALRELREETGLEGRIFDLLGIWGDHYDRPEGRDRT